MRKVACALLVLGLAACAGQGGDEAEGMDEMADTPAMSGTDTGMAQDSMMRDTMQDTIPCDTCMARDTAR